LIVVTDPPALTGLRYYRSQVKAQTQLRLNLCCAMLTWTPQRHHARMSPFHFTWHHNVSCIELDITFHTILVSLYEINLPKPFHSHINPSSRCTKCFSFNDASVSLKESWVVLLHRPSCSVWNDVMDVG